MTEVRLRGKVDNSTAKETLCLRVEADKVFAYEEGGLFLQINASDNTNAFCWISRDTVDQLVDFINHHRATFPRDELLRDGLDEMLSDYCPEEDPPGVYYV